MTLSELEQKLNKQKNRIGLVGGRLKLFETADAKEPVSAFIDTGDWHVEIHVKEGYQPVRDKATEQYVKKKRISKPLEKMCEDILYHECGHWELPRSSGKGCPYDETYRDAILESVTKILGKKGKEAYADHVSNAFEDVLVNLNCRLHTDHAGQILFWNEQGMTHGKYTKFYDAFVRLNLALGGNKADKRLLKRWYTNDKTVQKAVNDVLTNWGVQKGKVSEKVEQLYQKKRWEKMAEQFATIMEPLLDKKEEHLLHAMIGEDAFDKKMKSPDGQEKVAHNRYKAGRGPAQNRDSYEQLDALYRSLAREIPVEIDTFTHGYRFPIAPYGREAYDPEAHDIFTRKTTVGINEDGSVGLMVNRGWIETEQVYKHNIKKFPNFRLAVIDSSGSMELAPNNTENVGNKAFIPWGDKSKYHYALLGYYGIERYLQQQHIAPYVDAGVVNFSSETIAGSGQEAHKVLLTPQWGVTTLDINKLKERVKEETFLLTLSDGAIGNWESIKDDYKTLAQQCSTAHIQIGGKNQFSEDLESWGVAVYYVGKNDDLAKLMVKVASDKYKQVARCL